MEVTINDKKHKVYWMYNSQLIPLAAKRLGLGEERCKELGLMPFRKQVAEFTLLFPEAAPPAELRPNTTWCFIMEGDNFVSVSSVTRHHLDREDRDKARKYSLAKALTVFADRESRKKFWVAYLNRSIPAPVRPVIPMSVV